MRSCSGKKNKLVTSISLLIDISRFSFLMNFGTLEKLKMYFQIVSLKDNEVSVTVRNGKTRFIHGQGKKLT